MEITVVYHALITVERTHATYIMDPVLNVSLDGEERNVTQV